jgi:hypothetical protein
MRDVEVAHVILLHEFFSGTILQQNREAVS